VQDLRELVRQLTRLAEDAPRGALGDLVGELSRAAAHDGELTALLREAARLADAQADRRRSPAAAA
jgi:ABC-type transporter Mla subunit MlaD